MTYYPLSIQGPSTPIHSIEEQALELVTTASPPRVSSPPVNVSPEQLLLSDRKITKEQSIVSCLLDAFGPNRKGISPLSNAMCYTNPMAFKILTSALQGLFKSPGLYPLGARMEELVDNIKSIEFFGREIQYLNSDDRFYLDSKLLSCTRHEYSMEILERVSEVLPNVEGDPRSPIEIATEILSRAFFAEDADFERHVFNFSRGEGNFSDKVRSYNVMRRYILERRNNPDPVFLTTAIRVIIYNLERALPSLVLSVIPPELWTLTHLTQLRMTSSSLSFLPSDIARLPQLTILDVMNNELTDLPPELALLTNLKTLKLVNNRFNGLPPHIGQLSQLVKLDCSGNPLTVLPTEIGNLRNLKEFSFVSTRIETLPDEFKSLTKLETLNAYCVQFIGIPRVMVHFKNLMHLRMDFPKLEQPFTDEVKEWLSHLKSQGCDFGDNGPA